MSGELVSLEAPFHLYELLGTGATSTAPELRKAFHKRSLKLHPDKGGSAAAFAELREAYELLNNPRLRSAYDRGASRRRMLIRDTSASLCAAEQPLAVLISYSFQQEEGSNGTDCLWMKPVVERKAGSSVLVLELRSPEDPLLSLAMLFASCLFVVVTTPEDTERASSMFADVGTKVVMVDEKAGHEERLQACIADLEPRVVDGSLINGRVLLALLQSYTASFNVEGEVKYSPKAMGKAIERECQSVSVHCVQVIQVRVVFLVITRADFHIF
jgi:DnaJ family protein A protein 2